MFETRRSNTPENQDACSGVMVIRRPLSGVGVWVVLSGPSSGTLPFSMAFSWLAKAVTRVVVLVYRPVGADPDLEHRRWCRRNAARRLARCGHPRPGGTPVAAVGDGAEQPDRPAGPGEGVRCGVVVRTADDRADRRADASAVRSVVRIRADRSAAAVELADLEDR